MSVHCNALIPQLQTLFTTDADRAAHEAAFIQRRRKLTAPAFAQALVFAWLENPGATLDELTGALARAGVSLRPQSLAERFTPQAAEFFRRLLGHALDRVVATVPTAVALLRRFQGVYLLDSTQLALPAALATLWPGCGGRTAATGQAALKVMVRYELSTGTLAGLSLHPGRQADATTALSTAPLPAGALRLADLGFFDLDVLQTYDSQGTYFISRPQPQLILFDARGKKWKLTRYLASRRGDRVDQPVQVGHKRLACRLLASRSPAAVAAQRQHQARQEAQDHGRQISAARIAICGWTVFLTNVPRWLLGLHEVWVLYRARWQIELLFKLWKSDGGVDESRSGQAPRVLCEVYAKLVGMVVQHWLLLTSGGGAFSNQSQRKAARAVRKQIGHVAAVLGSVPDLLRALGTMAQMVAAAGTVNRRRGHPATFQTLVNPDHHGLT